MTHATKSQTLITDGFAWGLAGQTHFAKGIDVLAPERLAPVCYEESTRIALVVGQKQGYLAIAPFGVRIVGVLDQLDQGTGRGSSL